MKKMVIWIAFAICAIVMTSCSDLPAENKAETTAEPPTMQTTMEKTTTIETTMEVISTIELTEGTTTTKDTEVLPTEIETTTAETYETLPDMFERLMEFSGDRGYFYGKADIRKSADLANEEIGVHFRVVGFDHDYRGIWGSYYYVQIIETYGEEKFADQIEPIDREKIYLLHWRGHLDSFSFPKGRW